MPHNCLSKLPESLEFAAEMNPVFQRLSEGTKRLGGAMDHLISAEIRALRATNFFCLRFFVTLELALFYFVGVVYAAVVTLPESRFLYASLCGSAGVIAAWILRSTWKIGRRRF